MLRAKEQIQNRLYIYSCIADTPGRHNHARACPDKGTGAVGETVEAEKRGSCSATLLGVYVDHLVGVR